MSNKYFAFNDREIGFFESGEGIEIKVLEPIAHGSVETVDAWGRVCGIHPIEGEMIALGKYPVGWYRVFAKDENGNRIDHDYFAFTVTVPLESRYKGDTCFATDIAGEYEGSTIRRAEEIIRITKLQGFELTRGRSDIVKWSDNVLEYRKKVKESGLRTMAVAMNHYKAMPKIASIDLREIYNLFKEGVSYNEVVSDIVELVNEPDLMYSSPALADSLTAYCKAAFLGIADSEPSPYAAMPGLALGRDCLYSDIMLQNGMMDYSPVYNFHGYDQLAPLATYGRKVALSYAPEGENKVTYMSENGKKVWCGSDEVAYDDHMLAQARYAVTASTGILSLGIDKWFWFISRAFLEAGGGFGSLHAWSYQPYPVSASLANLTYVLGKGEYVGKIADLPEKCSGYMFDNGMGENVAVLFAPKECEVKLYANEVTVVDLFGGESRALCDADGTITLKASADPIFIRFGGQADERNYYRSSMRVKTMEKTAYGKNKRVVLNALWQDQDLSQPLVMQKGYLTEGGKVEHITLRIYNFNDTSISGEVFVNLEYNDQFTVEIEDKYFSVEPMGESRVNITLKANEGCMNSSGDIKFGAIAEGIGEVTPAVCRYWFKAENMPVADEDIVRFKDFIYPENWDLTNICDPGYIETETDEINQSITFKPNHGGGYAQWHFPVLKVKNPEGLEGTDGIVFRKKNNLETRNEDKMTVFVLTKDGRAFWSGHSSAAPTSLEWKTVTYPWETFGLYSSPEGFNDIRPFIPTEIVMIRVGVSGTSPEIMPETEIKDLGAYYDRFGATMPHPYSISFDNVTEGQIFKSVDGFMLKATMPPVKLDDIRAYIGKERVEAHILEDGKVGVDVSKLGRGEYTVQISGKTETDYRYVSFVTFYVN